MELPISDIRIGNRHRTEMGDIEELANSIEEQGLLQPIGVTRDNELVFGERRLAACRDFLKWSKIDVRVVDVGSIIEGELHENEIRKDFTPSERVAIASAIREQIGDRQGERTDIQPVGNCPQVKTREIAAQKAGFGDDRTYRRAQSVVDGATTEIVDLMDSGELSISAAAEIAQQPTEQQRTLARAPRGERREAVRMLRNIRNAARPVNNPKEQETLDKQAVLMAINTIVNSPIGAAQMATAMFPNQRAELLSTLDTATQFLHNLKTELLTNEQDTSSKVA